MPCSRPRTMRKSMRMLATPTAYHTRRPAGAGVGEIPRKTRLGRSGTQLVPEVSPGISPEGRSALYVWGGTMSLLSGIQLHPKNVEQALESLEQVTERLRARGDSRAVFPDVYGIITRIVAREVRRRTRFFQEPEWISRLAGRFAE